MIINFNHLKTFYNALKQKSKSMRGNWEQNDPTADDYIKNRPFYSERKEIIISKEQTINVDAFNEYYGAFDIVLKPGQEYTVNFNGEIYKCIARQDYEDELFIGNSSILGWYDDKDTGEPFFIDVWLGDDNPESTFASNIAGPHTISISTVDEVVKELDAKYIHNAITNSITSHTNNKSNPHDVTCDQIGAASATTVTSHTNNKSNPHDVTCDQIGAALAEHEHSYMGLRPIEIKLPVYCSARSVVYGDNKFVAVGIMGKIFYSIDAINWILAAESIQVNTVTYGNGKFVGIKYVSNKAAYSEDGINWIETTFPFAVSDVAVTYGNGKFVAVGYNTDKAAYSEDGINWIETTLPYVLKYKAIAYGDGKFIATPENAAIVAYSEDGINWKLQNVPQSSDWKSVAYGNGRFVTLGTRGRAMYSEDGITWTEIILPVSFAVWYALTYGNGKFVAIQDNGGTAIYSEDGINWNTTNITSQSTYYWSATYGNGKFVAACGNDCIVYSEDGINWINTQDKIIQDNVDITSNIESIISTSNSWNDLTDRPFGDVITTSEKLTYDGTPSSIVVGEQFHFVSSTILSKNDCSSGGVVKTNVSDPGTIELSGEDFETMFQEDGLAIIADGLVVSVPYNNYTVEGLTFPSAGIYFINISGMMYITEFSLNNFSAFECVSTQKLPERYIPDLPYASENSPVFYSSVSMGRKADTDIGSNSVAMGTDCTASGSYSNAEGRNTIATGIGSHAEGYGSKAEGEYAHAEGGNTTASGYYAHAEGINTTASRDGAHAEGENTTASGSHAHAEGYYTTASSGGAHAEGGYAEASGVCSHAEGYGSKASNSYSHAEGWYSKSEGQYSHAEGYEATASGEYSHAEGHETTASGHSSHAEGYGSEASNWYSHAEGHYTVASSPATHAEGYYTKASSQNQHVQGRYNIEDLAQKYAHIVGNGDASARSNAHTLDWEGNAWFQGDVYIGGTGQDDTVAEKLITESEVDTKLASLVNSAPEKLNTLDELAAALGDDENFANTVTTELSKKANTADLGALATKDTLTASDVGALPDTTVIPTVPTNVSAFTNDSGYLTEHQSLEGLATETFVTTQVSSKQDAITGTAGQFVGFDESGNAVAIDHEHSWDELTDKPFGEIMTGSPDTLTFDGSIDDKDFVSTSTDDTIRGFVKVSDVVPSYEVLSNGFSGSNYMDWQGQEADMPWSYSKDDIANQSGPDLILVLNSDGSYSAADGFIIFVPSGVVTDIGLTSGTWFSYDHIDGTMSMYASFITIPGYTGFVTKTVKHIDEKYLPGDLIPAYTAEDEGKVLKIVGGVPTWVAP